MKQFVEYDNGRSGSFTPTLKKREVKTMTDDQFENLKRNLYQTKIKLNRLQRKYRKETGKDYVISRQELTPVRPCPCKQDHGCFLPTIGFEQGN